MDIELPSTGCNIMTGEDSFSNYSPDLRTRQNFIIFNEKAIMVSEQTSFNPYTITGTCLQTGDLLYKPELKVYFPFLAFFLVSFTCILIYLIMFKRFIK